MRIALATVQVPFISGGAEIMTSELARSLNEHGHKVEIVSIPFRFNPPQEVLRGMNCWTAEYFDRFDCGSVDKVVCLKFPSFYLQHHNKCVWLMHQHRSVYELFDTPYGESSSNPDAVFLRDEIIRRDTIALKEAKKVYTISKRVSSRMKQYNGIDSSELYQPPRLHNRFQVGNQLPYIFFPSRLERLKRQELLIRSVIHLTSPTVVIIAGEGGQRGHLESLISELNLSNRIRLLGNISFNDMVQWYSNSLGIFFGPYDEDYGFITLEAMLSGKPVITCTDSGGPLEFVVDHQTGYIVEPSPEAVADAIDKLYFDRSKAKSMGYDALKNYHELNISWTNVVSNILDTNEETA